MVGSIVASYALDLASHGVTELGTVPGGLPSLSLPTDVLTLSNAGLLLPTVISMVVVILAQSAATSRAYAMRYGDRFDENVDLIGLGVANAAAGITGTFVVNGSPTKTEMVDSAGGRSQISQLTAGAIVVAVLLFLTGPLAYMPNAVLAAVVFLIGLKLVDHKGMRAVARLRPGEFVVAAITTVTVVVVGVEQGIILAMALSIVEHIYHSYRPFDTLLIESQGRAPTQVPLTDAPRPHPAWRSTASGPACTTRMAAASARRSWSSSSRPSHHWPGWGSPAHPSVTSTTRVPTPSGRSRRSWSARTSSWCCVT